MSISTAELCRIARATPRQVHWWAARGVIRTQRVYTPSEAVEIAIAAELRRRRLGLREIRRIVKLLRANPLTSAARYLVVRRRSTGFQPAGGTGLQPVLLFNEAAAALRFLSSHRDGAHLIDLGSLRDDCGATQPAPVAAAPPAPARRKPPGRLSIWALVRQTRYGGA